MSMSTIKEKLNKLPLEPGVYIFRDKSGKILYIGKATNLRSRVGSYFRGTETRAHIESMMPSVVDVDFFETDSVLEALILESNLIKKHQPKYNIDLKDDKSFSYFVVTEEEYPRVIIVRATDIQENQKSKIKNQNDNSKLKNSKFIQNSKFEIKYSNIYGPYTSRQQMQVALKIIRKIFPFHANKQKTEKGCLDFQIGLCPGPYADAISKEDYKKNILGIKMILEGKKRRLVTTLEKEMKEAAKRHEFEKAAQLRNKVFALQHIRDIALITREENPHLSRSNRDILSRKGEENKEKSIRIEAYDISNISGTNAVGSMVVFTNSQPDKSQYRKFKIKTIEGSDDVGMMKEILLRRFKNDWPASTRGNSPRFDEMSHRVEAGDRSSTRGWPMPDLILLDGGQGHVNMGTKLVQELGLIVPIAGVAKGPTRKKLLVHSSGFIDNDRIQKILDDKNLVKSIMDEAHRFAIAYHRKLRKKNFI